MLGVLSRLVHVFSIFTLLPTRAVYTNRLKLNYFVRKRKLEGVNIELKGGSLFTAINLLVRRENGNVRRWPTPKTECGAQRNHAQPSKIK